ncbi:hypothetical protein [Mucispirillum schaedleri]|jgi:hypothetical protein|uniref:Uncharacterized protein n=1 Tax=Mucispirillum schaedleri ASF457 TaxID=1379858 RepID=V2QBE4_9BACT|nr:hypothetical protein [Mucispirillum schaedleri]MCX4361416.1 hypothetical protein [Mucispirillum schaedleri]USF24723.1 hypothetical protein N508_001812 [Mucispirillum schaedleri ASF457]SIW05702.1 conserved hypothetical protein [Mucispirillum schaedleri ASF457]
MDNEYKVSWIDTNPQNSSYKNEYFAKIKTEKKSLSQDLKDKYEHRLQKGEFTVLDNIEAKSKLENVLSFLPNINPDGLVDNISYDFVSYCSSF